MRAMRPYLLRALYAWMIDSGYTPHLVVDATVVGVDVPAEHVKDGRITLNVSPQSVQGLMLGDADVTFSTRFSGVPRAVYLPMRSVIGTFARETGRGLFFEDEDFGDAPPSDPTPPPGPGPKATPGRGTAKTARRGPGLRVVK